MNYKNFSIGFSPCPNDTYIFAALINNWIDTLEFSFTPVIEDVENLNQHALKASLDITKLSFGVLPHVIKDYTLLKSGAAVGNACGPLIISKKPATLDRLCEMRLGIPGKMTSAYVFYRLFAPPPKELKEMLFSDIENALLNEDIDAGLIIHENRFTYQQKGLYKIADVGDLWENRFHLPVPLGAIAIKKNIPTQDVECIDSLIRESILYAQKNTEQVMEYVRRHAQELDETVIKSHIDLYVNQNSIYRSPEAEKSIETFMIESCKQLIIRD